MRNRVPSFFMLVPGPWRDAHELARSLSDRGIATTSVDDTPLQPGAIRVDVVEDDQLAIGFSWGREGRLADDLVQRVAACSHAALLECGMLLHESAANVAQLGRALRDAGGVAVRMEASGNASPWERWLERLESGVPAEIYKSAVILVGDDDGGLFTCGMHHFDLPDAEITMIDTREAMAWLDAFCIYELAESPVLMSGHTFRPDDSATRRTLERWPDRRHHPNDGRHNPFGLWRFKAPGTSKVEPRKLVSTIIPPLVATLLATERKQGRPLTQLEVEELVAKSPAIAMEPADAQTLERSRGYADIEPELAWEQWQIVRANDVLR